MTELAKSIDPSVLDVMRGQIGAAGTARVVALFKTDVARRLALFADLAPAQAAREAHAIKGSARATGALALAEAAHRLEIDAPGLAAGEIEARVAELAAAFEAACAAFDETLVPPSVL